MNPRAINGIRIFPTGIVIFGARTNHGDDDDASEYKYIPIRRGALYEESLYRGLKMGRFQPNDEPLWAQIRLNVGAFMHDLYRRGAFQGQNPAMPISSSAIPKPPPRATATWAWSILWSVLHPLNRQNSSFSTCSRWQDRCRSESAHAFETDSSPDCSRIHLIP